MSGSDVLRVEKVGDSKVIRLTRHRRQYRVVSIRQATPHILSLSTVKWTFRRAVVARLAFDFVVATERYLYALTEGISRGDLLRAVKRASRRLKSAMKKYADYPPETRRR